MKMRAAVLTKLNEPIQYWTDIEIPKLKRGQVLVRLAFSGVCHSQLMEARGGRGVDRFLPHLLGHEGTGVVIDVGQDVQKVREGDRVVLTWIKGFGIDSGGCTYNHDHHTVNAGGVTTFNEMAVVSENRVALLPPGIAMDVGVLFGCALLTGAGAVLNTLRPQAQKNLAVFGLGGVGLSALLASQFLDLKTIVAIDVEDEKLQLAQKFGATHVINAFKQDPLKALDDLLGPQNLDYAVEAAGLTKTIEQAFSAVRKNGGICLFASHPAAGEKIKLDPYDLICGKQILGTWGGDCQPDRDIPRIAQFCLQHQVPLEKMISQRYRLSNINQALDDLENRRVTRPLIEIDPSLNKGS